MVEKNNTIAEVEKKEIMTADEEAKSLDVILRKAEILLKSGLLPRELNTKEKVAVIMMKAKELNMPALEAISHLYVVNQKVAIDSTGMLALILRSGQAKKVQFGGDTTSAWCLMSRKDGVIEYKYTFTIEDAKRAGLTVKEAWQKYQKELLLARAISGCARKVFPDIIGGLYTVEELGGEEVPELPIEVPEIAGVESVEATGEQPVETAVEQPKDEGEIVVFEPESISEPKPVEKVVGKTEKEEKIEKEAKEEKQEKQKVEKTKEEKKEEKEVEKVIKKPAVAGERIHKILSIVSRLTEDVVEQQNFVLSVKKKLGLKPKVVDLPEEDFEKLCQALQKEVETKLAEEM